MTLRMGGTFAYVLHFTIGTLKNFVSFYAVEKLKCVVNGEIVKKQDGNFYGGWITTNLRGPFKGNKGTMGW